MATFNHSTREQLIARLRERYKTASGIEAAKIARFLASASDAELRGAFGVAQGQVASLKGRLQATVQRADALKASVGG